MKDKAGLESLLVAQRRLRELRYGGTSEADLRKLLLGFGFGTVTFEQFVAAESVEDLAKLLEEPDTNGLRRWKSRSNKGPNHKQAGGRTILRREKRWRYPEA